MPAADIADAFHVEEHSGGCLVVLAEQHAGFFGGDAGLQGGVVNILAERLLEVCERHSVILAEAGPAVAEGAAVDDECLAEGAHVVLYDRAHGAGTGSGVDDGAAVGAVDKIEQYAFAFEYDVGELLGSHVGYGLRAYRRNGGGKVARECVGVHHFSILTFFPLMKSSCILLIASISFTGSLE